MFRLICIVIGYFVGCIQTAYYVGKAFGKIDIRDYGSGNAGTTNITRTLGAKAGLITFLVDILKTVLVYIVCSVLFQGAGSFYTYHGADGSLGNSLLPGLYGGLGVVLGHNYPFQLKFRGGKGVAATLALFLCTNLQIALTSFGIGIVAFLSTFYISLGSLTASLIFGTLSAFSKFALEEKAIILMLAAMVFIKHKDNIKRLLSGTENKFSVKKRNKE